MFELMWDCFPQWCFDLRRRREASRFSGIVVSKGWWTDPNLGNLVHNACGKVCLNELSLDSYLVVHIYLWEANLKGTWGPWLPAVWGILGTSPLTPQFTQAPETSHPYRSRKAGAKSGWRCLHWMCLRNCFSSNPVAGTISNNAVFTLICSQDHLFPWAFRFHWERTSGTKMRKLMSWDRDSLIGEGKRKKKTSGITHPDSQADQWSNDHLGSQNSIVHFLYPFLFLSISITIQYGISLWPVWLSCGSQLHWKAESDFTKCQLVLSTAVQVMETGFQC